jgi:hypothetical protein
MPTGECSNQQRIIFIKSGMTRVVLVLETSRLFLAAVKCCWPPLDSLLCA